MSYLSYTTTELIETVRLRGSLPDHEALGTRDVDIIRILNEEMKALMLPAVMKVKEEYFVKTKRYTVSSGQSRYRIPPRASGLKLRTLHFIDSSSNRSVLKRKERSDVTISQTVASTAPSEYYIEGNYIVLLPDSSSTFSGTLEIGFYARPGDLVPLTEVEVVSAVDTSAGTITATSASLPSGFTAAKQYDVHSSQNGADLKVWGITPSSIDGNILTFTATDIDGSKFGDMAVEVGDYLCLTSEAAIPALPVELHVPLAQAAVVQVLSALDPEAANLAKERLIEMLQFAGYLVDSRVEDSPSKAVTRQPLWGDATRPKRG